MTANNPIVQLAQEITSGTLDWGTASKRACSVPFQQELKDGGGIPEAIEAARELLSRDLQTALVCAQLAVFLTSRGDLGKDVKAAGHAVLGEAWSLKKDFANAYNHLSTARDLYRDMDESDG